MSAEARDTIVKLQLLGGTIEPPSAQPEQQDKNLAALFATNKVLNWTFDPSSLIKIWENSSALNQNIETYIANIESSGHRLAPVFDFESDAVYEQVREALWVHDSGGKLPQNSLDDLPDPPSDAEVDVVLEKLKRRSKYERLCFESFLHNVNPNGSFMSLRRQKRKDLEILGNAFFETLRDSNAQLSRFLHVPAETIRLTALDLNPTAVETKVAPTPLKYETITQYKFFRRFVQVVNNRTTWFKEFGDPRVVSRTTGKIFLDEKSFEAWTKQNQPGDQPANEMIHFKIDRPGDAYGTPRWMGNLLAVLGSRAADEVNYNYFDNKTVPPMAIVVSGGRLGQDDIGRIENFIRDNVRGRSNFHKILLLEANADKDSQMVGTAVPPRVEFKPLTSAQHGDALFQNYDERNMDKVSSSFRMPRLMRGDVRDFNRATALAAIRFAEDQVFEPERREFDDLLNRRLLPELGILLWRLESLPTRSRDPELMSRIVGEQSRAGNLKPNEARDLLAPSLATDFVRIDDKWGDQPLQLTMAEVSAEAKSQAAQEKPAKDNATDSNAGANTVGSTPSKPAPEKPSE
jgi:PBSX family phage portal protein